MPEFALDYHRRKTPIDHQDGSIPPVKLSFSTMKKVAEIDVSSDITQITITGLNINTDKFYLLIFKAKNPTSSETAYYIFFEGDTNPANYYTQDYVSTGSSYASARFNAPRIGYNYAGENMFTLALIIRDVDGIPRWGAITTRRPINVVERGGYGGGKTAAVTNITRIDIVSSIANAIGAGSKIIMYGGV